MRWRRLADPLEVPESQEQFTGSPAHRAIVREVQESQRRTGPLRSLTKEMRNGKRYYYDPESCAFVEVELTAKERVFKYTAFGLLALFLASLFTLGLDRMFNTPQEVALQGENEALRQHLESLGLRMQAVQDDLLELAAADQKLYRELLQMEPISDDVRQAGVGGVDVYEGFSAFSDATASLLKRSAETIDQLERQIGVQASSFRQLTSVAGEHERQLGEIPAIMPTDGPVVSGYGMRRHPILKFVRPHRGVDILVPEGTTVVAPGDGVVSEVGRGGGLGRYVRIKHTAAGYVTTFAHLSDVPDGIRKGRRVNRGDVIGMSGNTGLSKAPHLHYEVRDDEGKSYNPVYFFAPSMTPVEYEKLLAQSQKGEVSLD